MRLEGQQEIVGESFAIQVDPRVAAVNYLRRFTDATEKDVEELAQTFMLFEQIGKQKAKKLEEYKSVEPSSSEPPQGAEGL